MKNIKIHFVCSGNVYRSRLAEAYLNSLHISGIIATSSGVRADRNLNGPITWYAMRLILNHGLIAGMSPRWQKTTAEIIREQQLVIFMEQRQFDDCKDFLGETPFEIWNVSDIPGERPTDNEIISRSEHILKEISKNVDELVEKIQSS